MSNTVTSPCRLGIPAQSDSEGVKNVKRRPPSLGLAAGAAASGCAAAAAGAAGAGSSLAGSALIGLGSGLTDGCAAAAGALLCTSFSRRVTAG